MKKVIYYPEEIYTSAYLNLYKRYIINSKCLNLWLAVAKAGYRTWRSKYTNSSNTLDFETFGLNTIPIWGGLNFRVMGHLWFTYDICSSPPSIYGISAKNGLQEDL